MKVENGKAYLELSFGFEREIPKEQDVLEISICDEMMQEVLVCEHPMSIAQPVKGMILHPHLWNSIQDPYCYTLRATLCRREGSECMVVESMEEILPIYTLEERGQKGWYLNDQPFSWRGVYYTGNVQDEAMDEATRQDLERIRRLGANGLYVDKQCMSQRLRAYLYRKGLFLWEKSGDTCVELTLPQEFETDNYYLHCASWSKEPFLHICLSSLQVDRDGTCALTIYSNQKRVALYCNGVIFEFKADPPDFRFEQIPVTSPMLLTVETQERTVSVSFYPD